MKRVFRFAEWSIGPTRDSTGHAMALVLEVQCAVCEEPSKPSADQAATDRWAMQHAGLTGHRQFLQFTTARRTVAPAPTNPLQAQEPEQEAAR